MATRFSSRPVTKAAPVWAGDFMGRDQLIPGGAKVVAAEFPADTDGRRPIPSGTPVGRTLAERDAGTGFGPAAAGDEEVFLVAFDVTDANRLDDVELYRANAGLVVKENFLPGFAEMDEGVVALLRERYFMTRGAE